MNTLIKTSIGRPRLRSAFILIMLVLGCFDLLPKAQALSPAAVGKSKT